MRLDHVDHVDIVEEFHACPPRFAEKVGRHRGLFDHHRGGDVLPPVDHVGGLQPPRVQPSHMESQQLVEIVGGQPSL